MFSTEPVVLVGPLQGSFIASFLLGWGVTTGAGLASYPLDTIRYVHNNNCVLIVSHILQSSHDDDFWRHCPLQEHV